MSPAPETLRRPSNVFSPPGISIASMLSRTPRAPNDSPGPFSADRRATSIRRNFSGGPRPAPFPHSVRAISAGLPRSGADQEAITAQDQLITALESRRRRIEELRNQAGERDFTSTISRQWRAQEARPGQVTQSLRPTLIPFSSETANNGTDDANDDVAKDAEPVTQRNAAGKETGHKPYQAPDQDRAPVQVDRVSVDGNGHVVLTRGASCRMRSHS